MFFQNRFLGPFLEGTSAELLFKVNLFVPLLIFIVFKKTHLDHLFAQVDENKEVSKMIWAVLLATLLFTKPQ